MIATPLPTNFHAAARVTGRGRERTLTWKLPRVPGIDYVLEESRAHVLAPITMPVAGSGRIRFRPATGPAGRRTVLVLVERNGLTVTTLIAGNYSAPGTPTLRGPRVAQRTNSEVGP